MFSFLSPSPFKEGTNSFSTLAQKRIYFGKYTDILVKFKHFNVYLKYGEQSKYRYHQQNKINQETTFNDMPVITNMTLKQINDSLEETLSSDVISIILDYIMYRFVECDGYLSMLVYSGTINANYNFMDAKYYFKIFDGYCLSGDDGKNLWDKCYVYNFIKSHPNIARNAVYVYDYEYDLYGDIEKNKYSFIDDFTLQSYDSPLTCLNLCRLSYYRYESPKGIKLTNLEKFVLFENDLENIQRFNEYFTVFMKYLNNINIIYCVYEHVFCNAFEYKMQKF